MHMLVMGVGFADPTTKLRRVRSDITSNTPGHNLLLCYILIRCYVGTSHLLCKLFIDSKRQC